MERAPLFVLDASVAVKWFVEEQDRDRALQVREDYALGKIELLAPGLMLYEVGNALRFHPNGTEEIGLKSVTSLRKMQFMLETVQDRLVEEAMRISYAEGISFYDSVYLALAEVENCKVISADEQLVKKLKKYQGLALLLGDYAR